MRNTIQATPLKTGKIINVKLLSFSFVMFVQFTYAQTIVNDFNAQEKGLLLLKSFQTNWPKHVLNAKFFEVSLLCGVSDGANQIPVVIHWTNSKNRNSLLFSNQDGAISTNWKKSFPSGIHLDNYNKLNIYIKDDFIIKEKDSLKIHNLWLQITSKNIEVGNQQNENIYLSWSKSTTLDNILPYYFSTQKQDSTLANYNNALFLRKWEQSKELNNIRYKMEIDSMMRSQEMFKKIYQDLIGEMQNALSYFCNKFHCSPQLSEIKTTINEISKIQWHLKQVDFIQNYKEWLNKGYRFTFANLNSGYSVYLYIYNGDSEQISSSAEIYLNGNYMFRYFPDSYGQISQSFYSDNDDFLFSIIHDNNEYNMWIDLSEKSIKSNTVE